MAGAGASAVTHLELRYCLKSTAAVTTISNCSLSIVIQAGITGFTEVIV